MATAPIGAEHICRIFGIMARHPELVCMVISIIFAFFSRDAKSEKKIYQAQPPPKHFFTSPSPVLDFPYGNLDDVGLLLEDEEVLFVMFYAPWCGKSMHVKGEFEKAAHYLKHEVQFVSINCWYDQGECRTKNSFHQFPVLYFYMWGTEGYRYAGLQTAEYIISFLERMLHPVEYLTSDEHMVLFLSKSDNSMVGFFDFNMSPQPPGYMQYFYAAMRVYERDHKNPIYFGVVTNWQLANAFGMKRDPTLYYCRTLNDTLKYPSSRNLTSTLITAWVFSHRQKANAKWLLPSGTKSLVLSTELLKGPALVTFLPDTPLENVNQYYGMLREVAVTYKNCDGDKKFVDMVETSQYNRWAKMLEYLQQLESCKYILPKPSSQDVSETEATVTHSTFSPKKCCLTVTLGNMSKLEPCVACINYQPESSASTARHGCNVLTLLDILPLWDNTYGGSGVALDLYKYFRSGEECTEWKSTYNPMEYVTFCCDQTHNHIHYGSDPQHTTNHTITRSYTFDQLHSFKPIDPFVTDTLQNREYRECMKVRRRREHKWLPMVEIGSLGFDGLDLGANISGLACETNKSLNFYSFSSKEGKTFAEGLGVNIEGNSTHQGMATLIVDIENEVHYKMKESFTKQNLAYFVQNFTVNLLPRHLRSKPKGGWQHCDTHGSGACFKEVTTATFHKVVMDTDSDVVLLYYTPWCGFCATFAHVFLSLARYFNSSKTIVFARINADQNDLPWQFTVDSYPSIVLYPAHKKDMSVVFADHLQKTLPNLVLWVLQHTTHSVKLETSVNICSDSCVAHNLDSSTQRVGVLSSQLVRLQGTIERTETRVEDLETKVKADSDLGKDRSNQWWLALLQRYIRLMKWQRNHKFLQKRNIKLLQSILRKSREQGVIEKRRLIGLLKQYEATQRRLAIMVGSSKDELDKAFLKELTDLERDWEKKSGGSGDGDGSERTKEFSGVIDIREDEQLDTHDLL